MLPKINIFGKDFPMYGICALVGLIFGGVLILLMIRKRRDYSKIHIVNIPIFAAIGAFVGAHIVYFITRLDFFVKAMQQADKVFSSWEKFSYVISEVFGGMVFYGGLLGAILAAFIYCKAAKVDFSLYADIFAPAIPLFHAFGRVGCVFAGCCYGLEVDWGIPVQHLLENNTIEWHNHVPIPLIEAGCNLLIMTALIILSTKKLKKGSLMGIYFICYSVVRFIDEFFRGDEIRGRLFGLSTSQWISIFVLALGIFMLLNRYVLKKKDSFGYRVPTGEVPEGYIYNKNAGAVSPHEQAKMKLNSPSQPEASAQPAEVSEEQPEQTEATDSKEKD